MLTHFFGFYSLAACVTAAVSQSKKAVSAVAAAVVGIGLFLAPMESAQGQGFASVPTIFSVDIDCYSNNFDVSWTVSADLWPNGYRYVISRPGNCFYEGGYTVVKLNRLIGILPNGRPVYSLTEWIEIWVWMGVSDDSIDGNPSAWVEDSEGNSYEVDLYIDGYLINGPSWPYGY